MRRAAPSRRRAVAIADNLTNTGENLALDWILGVGTPSRPATPLKVALVTANGSDTANGTEVAGGSYARKNLSVAAAVNGATSNSADLVWTGMPATTVVGVEVWDSASTPVRLWYGPLTASRTVAAGDELRLPAGSLTFTMS
ncbi:hypothetical protein ACFY2M_19250 [Streptomyces sp. NPDC001276]|uniref:phage tail fiber protein n=1 Tax=Streptomyces sp. NPDC001276 TaxID=3364555 RepID=UPI003689EAD5